MKRVSRAVQKSRIMKEFVRLKLEGKTPQYTVYGLAKQLGLERSPHLQELMLELCEEGQLEWFWRDHRPNRKKRVFVLASGWDNAPDIKLVEVFGGRTINFKHKGSAYQAAFIWGEQ